MYSLFTQDRTTSGLFNIITTELLLQVSIVIVLALLMIRLVKIVIPWLSKRFSGKKRLQILGLTPLLRLLIIIITLLIIIPMLIVPTPENLLAVFGTLGIGLGFALKDYVSSLLAGMVVLYEIPYRPGDWITIDDIYGEVKSIGLRTVELVTPDETVAKIPQHKLWTTSVFNANEGNRELLCVTSFYLHPNHDAELVKKTLNDVALTSPYLQIKRPITVIIQEKPWGTHYKLKAYPIDARDQFLFTTDLTARGKEALLNMGIEFINVPLSVTESVPSVHSRSNA